MDVFKITLEAKPLFLRPKILIPLEWLKDDCGYVRPIMEEEIRNSIKWNLMVPSSKIDNETKTNH